jgi:hypothetical protein
MLVILAIVATTTWLLFLKEFKFSVATFPLTVEFQQVAGIKAGAPVEILGVNRGKVRSVELMQDRVRVAIEIEQGTFIGEDARVLLVTDLFDPTSLRIVPGRDDGVARRQLGGNNNRPPDDERGGAGEQPVGACGAAGQPERRPPGHSAIRGRRASCAPDRETAADPRRADARHGQRQLIASRRERVSRTVADLVRPARGRAWPDLASWRAAWSWRGPEAARAV